MWFDFLIWTLEGVCGMALLFIILIAIANVVIGTAEIEFKDKGDDDGADTTGNNRYDL